MRGHPATMKSVAHIVTPPRESSALLFLFRQRLSSVTHERQRAAHLDCDDSRADVPWAGEFSPQPATRCEFRLHSFI